MKHHQKLVLAIDITRQIKPNPIAGIAYALRQLEADLVAGKGDIVEGIRLGMRGRQRLYDPSGNSIGFADIED